jgi:hypothetical protein
LNPIYRQGLLPDRSNGHSSESRRSTSAS